MRAHGTCKLGADSIPIPNVFQGFGDCFNAGNWQLILTG